MAALLETGDAPRKCCVLLLAMLLGPCATGCGGAIVEPGHRGLLFDPNKGGLQHEILAPGYHRVASGRVEDFDVTYSTRAEPLHVVSLEGLALDVRVSVIFRPIIAELYALDTEIGPDYYNAVVGPEFRAAVRACFAQHSYVDLTKRYEGLESQIESDVRRRVTGKHVEVASVTFESVALPPELVTAVRERLLAEETARKKKVELESAAEREKMESDRAWEREKLELQRNVERRRLEREAAGSH